MTRWSPEDQVQGLVHSAAPTVADARDGSLGRGEEVTPGEALCCEAGSVSPSPPGAPRFWADFLSTLGVPGLWEGGGGQGRELTPAGLPLCGLCAGSPTSQEPPCPSPMSKAERVVGPRWKRKLLDPAPGPRWGAGRGCTASRSIRGISSRNTGCLGADFDLRGAVEPPSELRVRERTWGQRVDGPGRGQPRPHLGGGAEGLGGQPRAVAVAPWDSLGLRAGGSVQ